MIKVVNSSEIKKLDLAASKKFKVPSIVLMENAAIGVVNFIFDEIAPGKNIKNVLILCGHGNNGGDGFAIARHIVNRGSDIQVIFIGKKNKLSNDAKINYEILSTFEKELSSLKIISTSLPSKLRIGKSFDLIIDALLGTGLNSPLRDSYLKSVEWANSLEGIKIAVDIPTGLSSDSGKVLNVCFKANYTLTMGLPKIGLLINDGPKYTGELQIVDISYPETLSSSPKIKNQLVEITDVNRFLPKREYDAHKYSVGKVLAIVGSKGLTGAAVMSAESALISGCGGVLLLCTEKLQNIFAKKLKEVMNFAVHGNRGDYFIEDDFEKVQPKIEWADVLLIGPGLGQASETQKFLLKLLSLYPKKKKVIDADGLNLLANFIKRKKINLEKCILTPHLGEFSKLIKKDIQSIKNNMLSEGSKFSRKHKCILVLKGAPTIIFDEEGNSFINATGNPGMATVGMGDVLTGIISGFYAQGISALNAAICGVFIHGLAGDIAKLKKNEMSLIASDVYRSIPKAISLVLKCKT